MKHMLDRLSGKADEEDDSAHASAKMQVLHELRNMAMDMMGDKVKHKMPGHEVHEVEVAAPDAAGLRKGLDMAKSVIPKSLNADRDSSFGEHLDSKLPHLGSNGSEMDDAAQDVEDQTEEGRSEPSGDEGEPDQKMLNPHRNQHADNGAEGHDDMYDDMDHDELDQHIQHLQKLRQSKRMGR